MKLLFDHNISPRLIELLRDVFSEASHVTVLGLERASDQVVWQYAKTHGYVLVSKDTDFNDLVTLRGFPPKVIWLRLGNCTTTHIAEALAAQQETIRDFATDKGSGLLTIM